MIAFQLSINGELAGTFGFEDWVILSASLTASKTRRQSESDEFFMHVNGVADGQVGEKMEHVQFGRFNFLPGDEVRIRIIETKVVDPPKKRYRSDHLVQESPYTEEEELEFEREEYERLKAKFEAGT